ncbi:hypothetical protein MAP00_006603 [Monascus purpureus]|nr:hypothetical protein MAP00_006603 [Monascus purpureus]
MDKKNMEKTIDSTETIPEVFESRKRRILDDLSVPDAEYTDLSPKGSVDEGIRDLIRDINALPGLVTTSSCAGRISVFLEGKKKQNHEPQQQQQRQFAPSGGKGTGRWLYVSHEPLERPESGKDVTTLHELFGLVPDADSGAGSRGKIPKLIEDGHAPRLVRFHFEPMILHIMTATLSHAQPVLAAASSSGFRESGLQSLRCLEAEDGSSPIVAVRSSGLSLESIIGYCDDDDSVAPDQKPVVHSLVSEEYLQLLVSISNERFAVNTERKERFCKALLDACSPDRAQGFKGKMKGKRPGWEDPEKRRERKMAEGLLRKKLLFEAQGKTEGGNRTEGDELGGIGDLL